MKELTSPGHRVAWFSAGITSAIATIIAVENWDNVVPIMIEIDDHHPDTYRFIKDFEQATGIGIEFARHPKYSSVGEVITERKYINGPRGAQCTTLLKKEVRRKYHNINLPLNHILGFEYHPHEIKRSERFNQRNPEAKAIFPLIEFKITKEEAAGILESKGIKRPAMYDLGYEHNNCIGCVKGGKGYWNKIRRDFPEVFRDRAEQEREIGASCINGTFLDELDPNVGRDQKIIYPSCGLFCTHKFL